MPRRFIDVSYEDRDLAKRLGARWDPSVKRWYYAKGSNLSKVFGWRSPGVECTNASQIGQNRPNALQRPDGNPSDMCFGDLFDRPASQYG